MTDDVPQSRLKNRLCGACDPHSTHCTARLFYRLQMSNIADQDHNVFRLRDEDVKEGCRVMEMKDGDDLIHQLKENKEY